MNHRHAATLLLLPLTLTASVASASGFIPNRGQFDPQVLYQAQIPGFDLYLLRDGMVLRILPQQTSLPTSAAAHSVRLRWMETAGPSLIEPTHALPTRYHFLRGADPAGWHRAVPSFAELLYRELRPGLDVRFTLERDALRVSIEADHESNPSAISFIYEGADRIEHAPDGVVRIVTAAGTLIHDTRSGRITRADAAVHPTARRDDPGALRWSGFLGGSLAEYGYSIAVRPSGETVVAGIVQSPDFPATLGAAYDTLAGSWDAFAAEIDSSGSTLNWATFLGGSQVDLAQAVVLASSGDLLLTGKTESADFPVTTGAYDTSYGGGSDAYLTRLSSDGSSVVWSGFLGGSAYEIAFGLVDDGNAGVIVGGYTTSPGYPTSPGAYDPTHNGGFDCFITKLDAAGAGLVWSTFFGGRDDDRIYDLARNVDGEIFLTAWTQSDDFPTTQGAYDRTYDGGGDAYVAKLSPGGDQLRWSTFLGGTGLDRAYGIAIASDGSPVVAGWTRSPLFPTTTGAFDTSYGGNGDGFVTKLDPAGAVLTWSGFIGGAFDDKCLDLILDSAGNAILTGATESADFPVTPDGFDTSYNGNGDAFIALLHADGSALVQSGYLGGGFWDVGNAIAVAEPPFVVLTGETDSSDYPVTQGAFDESWNGQVDIFATKIAILSTSGIVDGDPEGERAGAPLSVVPNPFSGATTISMPLPSKLPIEAMIHDLNGRSVRSLKSAIARPEGGLSFAWDGTDDSGNPLPSGIYFVRAGGSREGKAFRVVLLRP